MVLHIKKSLIITFLLVSAGCSGQFFVDLLAPEDRKSKALMMIDKLREGDVDTVFENLEKDLQTDATKNELDGMAELMPDADYDKLILLEYGLQRGEGHDKDRFLFEYHFGDRSFQVDATFQNEPRGYVILGLSAREVERSQIGWQTLAVEDPGALHFVVFGILVLLPATLIATMVVCVRTKGLRYKWLWLVLIAIGFSTLRFNWDTGAIEYDLLSVQFLSVSASFGQNQEGWIFGMSIPVGMIVFWVYRAKLKRCL